MADREKGPQGTPGAQQGTSQQGTSQQGMVAPRAQGGISAHPGMGMQREGSASPFAVMRRFMEEMDNLFEDFAMGPSMMGGGRRGIGRMGASGRGLWNPPIESFERDGQLVVRADLPGVSRDDVRVTLENDVLTVEGERRAEHEESRGGVFHSERSYGSFSRSIRLPEGVSAEQVQASFENGVLEVVVPMPQQRRAARTIEVRGGAAQGTAQSAPQSTAQTAPREAGNGGRNGTAGGSPNAPR